MFMLIFLIWPGVLRAEIWIVTQKGSEIKSLNENQSRRLWLGESRAVNGTRVTVVDQFTQTSIRSQFYQKIADMQQADLRKHRAELIFSKGIFPPDSKENDQQVIVWIMQEKNRLGYIDAKHGTPELEVLLKIAD